MSVYPHDGSRTYTFYVDVVCKHQSDGGDPPMELLPVLKELSYTGTEGSGDVFTSFVDAREIAGRPVSVMRLDKPRP